MTSSDERTERHTGDPFLAGIERSLHRGVYLKGDDRPLARILQDDAEEVARLGMDLEETGDRMKRLFEEGRAGLGDPVTVDGTFEVAVIEDRGILACPFRDHFASPKIIIDATNLKTGRRLRFSVLGMHMVREHGFFQGKGSPFRIEPEDLRDFFSEMSWTPLDGACAPSET
jgi:hypothetical protein